MRRQPRSSIYRASAHAGFALTPLDPNQPHRARRELLRLPAKGCVRVPGRDRGRSRNLGSSAYSRRRLTAGERRRPLLDVTRSEALPGGFHPVRLRVLQRPSVPASKTQRPSGLSPSLPCAPCVSSKQPCSRPPVPIRCQPTMLLPSHSPHALHALSIADGR
ncbi:hypothetical protein C8Q80DRAFT_117600 [Daedaleopsis nitida]|nr:hypothetical protein C8Q80DRAFT_117600 [Daedaleopsis nitida]